MDNNPQPKKPNLFFKSTMSSLNGLLNGMFDFTHYSNYHSYRKSIARLSFLLIAIVVFWLFGGFLIPYSQRNLLSSLLVFLLAIYLFSYYWINSKARLLKRDSLTLKSQLTIDKPLSKYWNVYDGCYDDEQRQSLEVAFVNDCSWIANWIDILRSKKKDHLRFGDADIDALQRYLISMQNFSSDDVKYVAYATMDDEIKNLLQSADIQLTKIPERKYLTKPGRWDYAAARGNFAYGLRKYPQFKAYVLDINPEDYVKRQKEESRKKAKSKQQKTNLIKLRGLKR